MNDVRTVSLSSLQNTSVLSPLVTMMILVPVPFLYYSSSPSPLRSHSLLFMSATTLPAVKATITMIVRTTLAGKFGSYLGCSYS